MKMMKTLLTTVLIAAAELLEAEPLVTDFVPGAGCAAFGITQFSLWTAPANAPDAKTWQGRCLIGSTNIVWDSTNAVNPCLVFVSMDFGTNAVPVGYSLAESFDINLLPLPIPAAPAIVGTHRP